MDVDIHQIRPASRRARRSANDHAVLASRTMRAIHAETPPPALSLAQASSRHLRIRSDQFLRFLRLLVAKIGPKPACLPGFPSWPRMAKMRARPARSGAGAASKNWRRWHADPAIFTGLLWREGARPG